MLTQLQQVARLYVTNRQVWWIVGWMALMLLPALSLLTDAHGIDRTGVVALEFIGLPVGGCIFLLHSQAKWQFCHPRARLYPNFAAPHLAVIGVVVVTFVALLPLALSLWGFNALGALACAATLAAPFLWASHATLPLASLASMALFFSLYNGRVAEFWLRSESAARWLPYNLALLAAGWLAIIAWFWRLTQIREDDGDYGLPLQAHMGSATRMERTQTSRAVMLQLLKSPSTRWICDWWHDRLTGRRAASTAERRRLLRYGFAALPTAASALWMALFFILTLWIMSQTAAFKNAGSGSSILPAMNIVIIMPGMSTFGMLAMRRPRMPQELMLPLSREQYIDGLLVASARSAAASWATVHAALLGLLAVISPAILTWQFVCALTALSLGAQVYALGVITRVTQIQQGSKRTVAMMAALIPAIFVLALGLHMLEGPSTSRADFDRQTQEEVARYAVGLNAQQQSQFKERLEQQAEERWQRDQPYPLVAWAVVAVVTAAGAAVLVHSRRRWLNLELA